MDSLPPNFDLNIHQYVFGMGFEGWTMMICLVCTCQVFPFDQHRARNVHGRLLDRLLAIGYPSESRRRHMAVSILQYFPPSSWAGLVPVTEAGASRYQRTGSTDFMYNPMYYNSLPPPHALVPPPPPFGDPPAAAPVIPPPPPPPLPLLDADAIIAFFHLNLHAANIFICPIDYAVMVDPVVADDGYTYNRRAIIRWLSNSARSPMTGLALSSRRLVTNWALRNLIAIIAEHSRR